MALLPFTKQTLFQVKCIREAFRILPWTVRTCVRRQTAAAETRAFLLILPSFSINFSFCGAKMTSEVFCEGGRAQAHRHEALQ